MPAFAADDVAALGPPTQRRRRPATPRRRAVGGLVHRLLRPRRSAGPRSRCCEAAGLRVGVIADAGLLRADLDHAPASSTRARRILRRTRRRAAPVRRARASRSSGWSRPALATLRRDAAELHRRPAGRRGRGAASARWPSCWPAPPGWTPPDLDRRRRSWPSRTATTTRAGLGRRRRAARAAPAPTVTRVGGCCGLAGNFGVEQGHYEVSVAVAEHAPAAGRARPRRGRRGARRRVLLPHPARRPRRRPGAAPGRAAGRRGRAAVRPAAVGLGDWLPRRGAETLPHRTARSARFDRVPASR